MSSGHRRGLAAVCVFLVGCVLAGCGEDTLTLRGRMLPDGDVTDVYVVGQPIRSAVQGDSFVVAGIEGKAFELEFTDGDDQLGRMRIEDWMGTPLTLQGIWLDDGTAFATSILEEGRSAVVNGLRLRADGALPRRVEVQGIVLASSRRGDALVVRPVGQDLPDLRVVVTPGTALPGPREDVDGINLDFGDSVWVEGTSESGYVVATRLVPRDSPRDED